MKKTPDFFVSTSRFGCALGKIGVYTQSSVQALKCPVSTPKVQCLYQTLDVQMKRLVLHRNLSRCHRNFRC